MASRKLKSKKGGAVLYITSAVLWFLAFASISPMTSFSSVAEATAFSGLALCLWELAIREARR